MSWDLLLVPREHAGDAQDWSEAMLDEITAILLVIAHRIGLL